jgi:hypothetical protein
MEKQRKIPSDALRFIASEPAEFGKGEDDRSIALTVYDGGISKHSFWGNLAFDMAGFRLLKSRIPIFQDHDLTQRVGFSTAVSMDGKIVVMGQMLKGNEDAEKIRNDAKQGFPFEASMGIDLDKCKVVDIPEGVEREVNGKKFKGPGTVFEKTTIREVSVTPFGALGNTKSEVYALNDDGDIPMEMTLEKFKADFADLYNTVVESGRSDAEKGMRDRMAAIRKVCPDAEIAMTAWESNQTPDQARIAFLEKENADLKAKAEMKVPEPEIKNSVDPAKQEFMDADPTKKIVTPANEGGRNFAGMTDEQFIKAHGELWDKDEAVRKGFMSKEDYIAFKKSEREGRIV